MDCTRDDAGNVYTENYPEGGSHTIWLPRILSTEECRGDEEDAQWRAAFGPTDGEFLLQTFACSLAEGKTSSFDLEVHPEWAPLGAGRFKELVESGFYDDTRFFRVIPTFMVQFGLHGEPSTNAHWRAKTIKDEPVKVSNKPGYITFAKTGAPNSRTSQLFINYVDNGRLDGMGFAPFGEIEGDGASPMALSTRAIGMRSPSSPSGAIATHDPE